MHPPKQEEAEQSACAQKAFGPRFEEWSNSGQLKKDMKPKSRNGD
jgi:hypothetical protein